MTEVFVDANFIRDIGNPHVEADTATARAEELLTELAPR